VLLTLFLGALTIRPPSLAVFLEGKIYDSIMRFTQRPPDTGSVAVVDLDEGSLAALGQWPWPRYRIARLLGRIREAGASAVGLDVMFAESDRTSLRSLSEEIRRDLGANIPLKGLPPDALDTDQTLAEALSKGPFVLGYQFDFDESRGKTCVLHPLRTAVRSSSKAGDTNGPFDAPGVICNLPVLSRATGASGFFNVTADPDGVLRRVPLVIKHNGAYYPSLALAVYLRARGGDVLLETGQEGVIALRLDGRIIPLDRRGNLMVNYRGRRRTFLHVSAASVLNGTAAPGMLKGKMVILGTTAAGLHEIRTTPLESAQPGAEIHANVLDDLIAGDPIAQPDWTRGLEFTIVLVTGFLMTGLLARARASLGVAAILPSAAILVLGSYWLMVERQIYLPPLMPVATIVLVFMLLTSLRYLQADREMRERTRKLSLTQDAIIQSLAALAETRHHETGGHIQRTRHYMKVLAVRLSEHPRFREYLDPSTVDMLFRLAPLHDIGKVGVRDEILLKPGRLTTEEFEEMKRHTLYGSETIRQAQNFLGEDSFLQVADEIALNHHERWDGAGYPRGFRGDEIPIPGRFMALADAYDAIISVRGYKPAIPHDEAVRIITGRRGTHFDPDVVDAFLEVREEFRRISERFVGAGVEPEPPA